ncbi:glycosyltransferase family 4 protein [Sphaerisporangium sp. NPDC051011]|uniref:glycosyltransferase family 4 protein n=1 Tax=Sphaerisporangium sp. NPDC051011 TaxID=3155792 RepID=UPI0033DB9221
MSDSGGTVLHVIVPQREGAIGGSDLHVLDLAVVQQRHGHWRPIILAPRATLDYRERLAAAGLTVLPPLRPGWLWRLPSARGIGMIHGHGYEANYLIVGLRTLSRGWARPPAVVTAHGWIENTPSDRVKSTLDRLSMRFVDLRIASAQAHHDRLRAIAEPAVILHNGVPAPSISAEQAAADGRAFRQRHGIDPNHVLIGSVGRLSTEKRIDLVLQAGARLPTGVHLLVVGGGAQRAELEQMAARLALAGRATFTGLLKDVGPALAALDVLLQPSDTEGSPRSVLEAMARGVPVIATDVGDVRALLDDGRAGILVPRDDLDALTRAVRTLIDDRGHARALAERARERYGRLYTVEMMGAKVHDIYTDAQRAADGRRR